MSQPLLRRIHLLERKSLAGAGYEVPVQALPVAERELHPGRLLGRKRRQVILSRGAHDGRALEALRGAALLL